MIKYFKNKDGLEYKQVEGRYVLVTVPETLKDSVCVIMDGTNSVDAGAFPHDFEVDEIYIPGSMTEIEPFAFAYLRAKKIIIGEGVEIIRSGAFEGNEWLCEVILPKTLKAIEGNAFESCIYLKNMVLPEGLESIGKRAFMDTGLKEIVIPKSVKSIGAGAFSCNIETIRLDSWIEGLLCSIEKQDFSLMIKSGTVDLYVGDECFILPRKRNLFDKNRQSDVITDEDDFLARQDSTAYASFVFFDDKSDMEAALKLLKVKGKGKKYLKENIIPVARMLLDSKRDFELAYVLQNLQIKKDDWKEILEMDLSVEVRAALLVNARDFFGEDFEI